MQWVQWYVFIWGSGGASEGTDGGSSGGGIADAISNVYFLGLELEIGEGSAAAEISKVRLGERSRLRVPPKPSL